MNDSKRVVITGRGWVTPLGLDIDTVFQKMLNGESGISKIDPDWFQKEFGMEFDEKRFPSQIAGKINFDINAALIEYFGTDIRKKLNKMANFSKLAVLATHQLMKDNHSIDKQRLGVSIGSGIGGGEIREQSIAKLLNGEKASAMLIYKDIINEVNHWVANQTGARGPGYSIVTACASATHCIGQAFVNIRYGLMDSCICGGTEAAIIPTGLGGFGSMRALSTKFNDRPEDASRAFDRDHDGFVQGEGAGLVLLESLESAKKRNATIYGEIIGYGASIDGKDPVAPMENGEGISRALKNALSESSHEYHIPDSIYINSHGTSTPTGDSPEIIGIINALGKERAKKTFVNSTKSIIGHSLGASGGLEAIVCIESLRHGKMHPTLNLNNIAEKCLGVNFITKMTEYPIKIAVSNSLGFGGQNAVIVFQSFF